MDVRGLDLVLSAEGWPYASALPTESGDPGRFHALFGRDALITSLEVLSARPDVSAATLRALAAEQGSRADPVTQEEPGKIGHEFRDAPPAVLLGAGLPDARPFRYYATADATSWFLVVLAAADGSLPTELRAHWRAAGDWLARALEAGDGLLRHRPGSAGGLGQQGWRDTIDPALDRSGGGILRPDGTTPEPPLADADTQAVTVAALRALARLSGDACWQDRADAMVRRLSELFLPDVMALEAGDRPVPGAGSQLGWLLWADALTPSAAAAAADRLCRPDILTAFGVRTLSSDSPVFRADGYHRGSVWPFDCWLAWGGLRAAGRVEQAERLRAGVLAALDQLGRFPELYAVEGGARLAGIPVANRVQAWTIGARWALTHRWDGRYWAISTG